MSKYKVGAYIRLSRDDKYSESDSIENQKIIFDQYVKEHDDFEIVDYYIVNGFSGAIRKTLLMGGDTDTNCAIVGSMAEAMYGINNETIEKANEKIPQKFVKILSRTRS